MNIIISNLEAALALFKKFVREQKLQEELQAGGTLLQMGGQLLLYMVGGYL